MTWSDAFSRARGRWAALAAAVLLMSALPAGAGVATGGARAASPRVAAAPGDDLWDDRFGMPGTEWDVRDVVEDASNVYVGGTFHSLAGQPFGSHEHLARWDGRRWHELGSAVTGEVTALAVDSLHRLYAAWDVSVNGDSATKVAMWNGTAWQSLGSGAVNGTVNALLVDGSDVYLGGRFTSAGGVAADSLARWSSTASTFSAVGGGVLSCFFCGTPSPGTVNALAKSGSTLYVAGNFNQVNRAAPAGGYSSIASWNGTSWSALGGGLATQYGEANVNALAVDGGSVYAAGDFTEAGSASMKNLARWTGSAWAKVGTGEGVSESQSLGDVYALEMVGSVLYAGGTFDTIDGFAIDNLARWSGSAWSAAGNPDASVYALDRRAAGGVHAGGLFETVGGTKALNSVGAFDGTVWHTFGQGATADGPIRGKVRALASGPDGTYAVGTFDQLGDAVSRGVARWDGFAWQGLQGGISKVGGAHAYAAARIGSDVYVGGNFTHAGSKQAANVARWRPGSGWSALSSGTDGTVFALTVLKGQLYAAGQFTSAGGKAASHIARYNPATNAWTAIPGGHSFDGDGFALATIDDRYLALGGGFSRTFSPGGTRLTGGLLIFDSAANTWLSPAAAGRGVIRVVSNIDAPGDVRALAVMGHHLYVGGYFDKSGIDGSGTSVSSRGLLRLNMLTSRWEAPGQVVGNDAEVFALATSGETLWVGGDFTTAGSQPSPAVATLNTATGTWAAVGSGVVGDGFGDAVMTLLPTPGRLWVGGDFVYAGAKAATSISSYKQPPGVVITSRPSAFTTSTSATVAFVAEPVGAGISFTCELDGGAALPCTSPYTVSGLTSGHHRVVVRASDATGAGLPGTVAWFIDRTGPTTKLTSPTTTTFSLSSPMSFRWASTDTGSGVGTSDARWRSAPYSTGFGAMSYPSAWTNRTMSSTSLSASPGRTYCVSARARDKLSNVGSWAAERCRAMPLDDRSFVRSTGWKTATGTAFYRGTYVATTKLGAKLTRSATQGKRYALVATRCSTCGKVGIYAGSTLLKTVNLYRSTTQRKYVYSWVTAMRSGTISIKVLSSGKTVQIDGFGISRS